MLGVLHLSDTLETANAVITKCMQQVRDSCLRVIVLRDPRLCTVEQRHNDSADKIAAVNIKHACVCSMIPAANEMCHFPP